MSVSFRIIGLAAAVAVPTVVTTALLARTDKKSVNVPALATGLTGAAAFIGGGLLSTRPGSGIAGVGIALAGAGLIFGTLFGQSFSTGSLEAP